MRLFYNEDLNVIEIDDTMNVNVDFDLLESIANAPGIDGLNEIVRVVNGMIHPNPSLDVEEVEYLQKLMVRKQ